MKRLLLPALYAGVSALYSGALPGELVQVAALVVLAWR